MFAGNADKTTVAGRARFLCLALRTAFDDIANFADWLAAQTDADLTGEGFTAQDVTWLRSTFHDYVSLHAIWKGKVDPNSIVLPYDFTVNSREIIGAQ